MWDDRNLVSGMTFGSNKPHPLFSLNMEPIFQDYIPKYSFKSVNTINSLICHQSYTQYLAVGTSYGHFVIDRYSGTGVIGASISRPEPEMKKKNVMGFNKFKKSKPTSSSSTTAAASSSTRFDNHKLRLSRVIPTYNNDSLLPGSRPFEPLLRFHKELPILYHTSADRTQIVATDLKRESASISESYNDCEYCNASINKCFPIDRPYCRFDKELSKQTLPGTTTSVITDSPDKSRILCFDVHKSGHIILGTNKYPLVSVDYGQETFPEIKKKKQQQQQVSTEPNEEPEPEDSLQQQRQRLMDREEEEELQPKDIFKQRWLASIGWRAPQQRETAIQRSAFFM
eukprot:TRINITY_DN36743_c0_g1_i3.p1 TRINITY_DN36743_c0_g1~~TRINITY_DN36743_c0_g1_i3.p1  ORF type:complete len:342 (+),score=81.45 TRINITY_DN36743_c0_g1_i3:66-1091(+)